MRIKLGKANSTIPNNTLVSATSTEPNTLQAEKGLKTGQYEQQQLYKGPEAHN